MQVRMASSRGLIVPWGTKDSQDTKPEDRGYGQLLAALEPHFPEERDGPVRIQSAHVQPQEDTAP